MPQFVADLCAGLLMKDGRAGRTIARENRGGFRLVSIRFWRNPTECQNEKTRQKAGFSGVPEILKAFYGTLYGAGTRSRTRDLLITSQLLYQLSYTGVLGRRL